MASRSELIYDPIGSMFDGVFKRGAYGGHETHVHAAEGYSPELMLALIRRALRMGLSVRENPYTDPVDPVHTKGSFHYSNFKGSYNGKKLGEAIDVSGDPAKLRRYFRFARRRLSGDGAPAGRGKAVGLNALMGQLAPQQQGPVAPNPGDVLGSVLPQLGPAAGPPAAPVPEDPTVGIGRQLRALRQALIA